MTRNLGWLARVVAMFAWGLIFVGAPLAQTATSVEVRKFEVISVDGNQLIFRDERGTNELTVPDGFRFTVDGKQLAVSDLKPGMKGTATVTTATTVVPVVVTEIRKGVVLSVAPYSLIVKDDADGIRKRFTQAQVNERAIKIFKEGRVIAIRDVKVGDELTAMIVTQGAPVVVTEQEVQATLAQATPAKTEAPTTTTQAATPAASAQPTGAAPAMAASPASAAVESSGFGMTGWLLIILVIAAGLFFFARRKKGQ
jgi:hypothetical protein